jgi:hypothetical protein
MNSPRLHLDARFQDQLVWYLCHDPALLKQCVGIVDSADFSTLDKTAETTARAVVARCALDHYKKYGTPIGDLLGTTVAANGTRRSAKLRKALRSYIHHLNELKPGEAAATVELLVQFKKQIVADEFVEKAISSHERGELTANLLRECAEQMDRVDAPEGTKILSASELIAADLEMPSYLVRNLIPAGALTVLAGKKGEGKTTLALQLGVAVARGGKFLKRKVRVPGPVLLMTLEDSEWDLQTKLKRIIGDAPVGTAEKIYIVRDLPKLPGAIPVVARHLKKASEAEKPYVLAVVDPFLAVAPQRRGTIDLARADYNEIQQLKRLATDSGTAILVCTHSPKSAWMDARDRVLGTTGFVAAADALLIMSRDPQKSTRKALWASGRSFKETVLKLELTSGGFQVCEEGAEAKAGPEAKRILKLLRLEGPKRPQEIASKLDKPDNVIHQILHRMLKRQLVNKEAGRYSHPGKTG